MSNIDKQAVQAVADLKAGYTLGHADVEIIQQMALDAVTLLDELEAAEKRIADLEEPVLSKAAADVLAERQRQQSVEGWTPEHDDQYEDGELVDAAACYAQDSSLWDCAGEPPCDWPWPDEWWKPTNDMRRNLIKAGALILAEIERRDRAAGTGKGE
ncbi:hypothetical protein RJO55_002073 [Enterobacter hormaechei]|nr:hypothetical protein [Enterobacter hormaechei]